MKNRIKNLYDKGAIGTEGILNAIAKNWITVDEAIAITGKKEAVSIAREAKVREISKACNQTIVSGIDLELANTKVHFNLAVEDQSNIANLFRVIELGGTEYPYQADGGVCRVYSASEISQIYFASRTFITYQTTYHNTLKSYVLSLNDVDEINAITYGMKLPDEYETGMKEKLSVAESQLQLVIAKVARQIE